MNEVFMPCETRSANVSLPFLRLLHNENFHKFHAINIYKENKRSK